jgi:hypothetical protein
MAAPAFKSARRLSLRLRDFAPALSLLDPLVSTMATLVGHNEPRNDPTDQLLLDLQRVYRRYFRSKIGRENSLHKPD